MNPWTSRFNGFERLRLLPRSAQVGLACLTGLASVVVAIAFFRLEEQESVPLSELVNGAPRETERPAGLTAWTAVVTSDVLNIREAASDTSEILGSLFNGQRVMVVGERVNGFVPVAFGTGHAWMADAYLAPDDATAGGERWIEVDRGTAIVALHEGARVVATFQGTVGSDQSDDGYYATAPGTFHVYSMAKDLAWTPFADDGYITDWVGFDPERSNGFHSPIRDASGSEKPVQSPGTKGCVRLTAADAARVFAFSSLGMRVEIHD